MIKPLAILKLKKKLNARDVHAQNWPSFLRKNLSHYRRFVIIIKCLVCSSMPHAVPLELNCIIRNILKMRRREKKMRLMIKLLFTNFTYGTETSFLLYSGAMYVHSVFIININKLVQQCVASQWKNSEREHSELDIFIWLIESFLMIALLSCTHSFQYVRLCGSFNVIFDYFFFFFENCNSSQIFSWLLLLLLLIFLYN